MPHVSMEYAIMVPVLLVQVILLPMAVSWMIDIWAVRRRENALQDVASHVGTTVQQLYFSLNRDEIAAGVTTQSANVPPFIESTPYIITASEKRFENSTTIDLYLALVGMGTATTTHVTLGPNVLWKHSTFVSNSTSPNINVEKFSNKTLCFWFG